MTSFNPNYIPLQAQRVQNLTPVARYDLNDLEAELKSNILNSYLADNNFSQNLISKQEIIDSVNFSKTRIRKLGDEIRLQLVDF